MTSLQATLSQSRPISSVSRVCRHSRIEAHPFVSDVSSACSTSGRRQEYMPCYVHATLQDFGDRGKPLQAREIDSGASAYFRMHFLILFSRGVGEVSNTNSRCPALCQIQQELFTGVRRKQYTVSTWRIEMTVGCVPKNYVHFACIIYAIGNLVMQVLVMSDFNKIACSRSFLSFSLFSLMSYWARLRQVYLCTTTSMSVALVVYLFSLLVLGFDQYLKLCAVTICASAFCWSSLCRLPCLEVPLSTTLEVGLT